MMNALREELHKVKSKVQFYLSLGRFQVAEKLLQESLAEHGSLAHIHNLLGLTYHKQSRFPEALQQFKKAQECNPHYTEATLNIIATLCDLSCYEQAQQIYEVLAAQADEEPATPYLSGRLADRHAHCGHLYQELNRFNEAIREYEMALKLYPRLPEVKMSLAQLYMDQEQFDKAERQLNELLAQTPDLAKPHVDLGIICYKTGRKAQARLHWDKAYQLAPQDPVTSAYLQLAADWPLDGPLPTPRPL